MTVVWDELCDRTEAGEIAEGMIGAGLVVPALVRSWALLQEVVNAALPDETAGVRDAVFEALASRCPSLLTEPLREREPPGDTVSNPNYGTF